MKKIIIILLVIILPSQLIGQIICAGGGLTFSSGVDFNTIETGNPGIYGKMYIKIFEKGYILPSVSAYNRYYRSTVTQSFKNYMFQGDLDMQYLFVQEGPLRFFGQIGGNATIIMSHYDVYIGEPSFSDKTGFKPGINLGAGVEMYINDNLDSVLSAKYIAGPWAQFVIQLGVFYHFYDRRRIGW